MNTPVAAPPRRLLRKGGSISRQNGRMKMAKAIDDTKGSDKPVKTVKTGKPGKPVAAAKPSFFERIGQYFRDVRAEMTRVVWPTRTEVLNSSVVVITTLIFFIVFITLVDYVIVVPLENAIAKLQIPG